MDYPGQRRYLSRQRQLAALAGTALVLVGGLYLGEPGMPAYSRALFVLIMAALVYGLWYLPPYLHLTVDQRKKLRWAVRMRWILIAVVAVLGVAGVGEQQDLILLWLAVGFLSLSNFVVGRRVRGGGKDAGLLWRIYFLSDFGLLFVFTIFGMGYSALGWLFPGLIAISTHQAFLLSEDRSPRGPVTAVLVSLLLLGALCGEAEVSGCLYGAAFVVAVIAATNRLSRAAQNQNQRNVRAAVDELAEFTGKSEKEVEELLLRAPEMLAEAWRRERPEEGGPEALARWYERNSFYYLFDLTAFSLTAKQIAFTLNLLRLARGRCLDYGAGSGQLAVELAHGEHEVTYFDVEGRTQEFARRRAERAGIELKFLSSKQDLEAGGYDTVYSVEVLEHLPDLEGELRLLASLLRPGGMMVLTIPSGPTKSHPMHLEHRLDTKRCLRGLGLRDVKGVRMRWTGSETLRKGTTLVYQKHC